MAVSQSGPCMAVSIRPSGLSVFRSACLSHGDGDGDVVVLGRARFSVPSTWPRLTVPPSLGRAARNTAGGRSSRSSHARAVLPSAGHISAPGRTCPRRQSSPPRCTLYALGMAVPRAPDCLAAGEPSLSRRQESRGLSWHGRWDRGPPLPAADPWRQPRRHSSSCAGARLELGPAGPPASQPPHFSLPRGQELADPPPVRFIGATSQQPHARMGREDASRMTSHVHIRRRADIQPMPS